MKLSFEFSPNNSSQTNQPSSEQTQSAGLGDGRDDGVATGDRYRSGKAIFASVNREYHAEATNGLPSVPSAANVTGQGVVARSVSSTRGARGRPGNGASEGPGEDHRRKAIRTVAQDLEGAASAAECATGDQIARRKRARRQRHTAARGECGAGARSEANHGSEV